MISSKKGRGNSGRLAVTDEFPPPVLDYMGVRSARASLFFAGKGDERNVPAALHRHGDFPLMSGAVARDSSRQDLAALGNEEPQSFYVLVIDKWRFIHAEAANFLANLEPPPFVAASARTAIISVASAS
jgi:hypothetical protein